jgi:carboxymethylenebutenolidase
VQWTEASRWSPPSATLTGLGIEHDVKEYPNAGHSFLNDRSYGRGPVQAAAHRTSARSPRPPGNAWQRIEALFATHLAG